MADRGGGGASGNAVYTCHLTCCARVLTPCPGSHPPRATSCCTCALRQYLRQAYVDRLGFLPPSWLDDPDDFHLRSDDVLRTLQSAQALFEGLYPPQTDKLATKQVRAATLRCVRCWQCPDPGVRAAVCDGGVCRLLACLWCRSMSRISTRTR